MGGKDQAVTDRSIFYIGGDKAHYSNELAGLRGGFAGLDKSRRWKITIEKYVKRRTSSQNGLYHVWIDIIAQDTGNDNDDLHEFLKEKFCPVKTIHIGGEEQEIHSTKYLTTAEMSRFMERVLAWAATTLNITLPPPEHK